MRLRPFIFVAAVTAALSCVAVSRAAEFISAEPVSLDRILALPATEQKPWLEYLARSQKQLSVEKEDRATQARAAGQPELKLAPYASVFGVNLNRPVDWFATDEGKRITANILSYQTLTGGFSKRLDLSKGPRPAGGDFVSEHNAHYEGTFDNDSTTTQLRALARAFKATSNVAARDAFLRGLNYIFISQYPNGGWP